MEPISPKHITVTDPFWAPRIRTVADIVLPYQWQVLHDQVPGAPKSSCIANFQKAAHAIAAAKAGGSRPTYPTDKWYYDNKNSQENAFMGWVFQDSDLYKWLEAAAYAIPYGNRAYLTEKSREAAEIIAAAQETDGYLDTLYSINGLQNRFTNLKDYHELYCFGHLAQAACARWTMQGERDLLDIACRAADCICRTFGRGKRPGYPGHWYNCMRSPARRTICKQPTFLSARGAPGRCFLTGNEALTPTAATIFITRPTAR